MFPSEAVVVFEVLHFDQARQREYHAESAECPWIPNDCADVWHEDGEEDARHANTAVDQVLSLTRLYSVDFSQKCILNKRLIKVCDNCFFAVLGLTRHTWQCPCFSGVTYATHEASRGPLKGAVPTSRVWQWDKIVAGMNERKWHFSYTGSLIWAPGINDFVKTGNRTKWR